VNDGRKYIHARPTAALATLVTVVGLELATAGTASAAPVPSNDHDHEVAAAQALADRLSHQVDATDQRHDKVQASLKQAQKRAHALTGFIRQEKRSTQVLRAQVAGLAGDSYDASGGYSSPPPVLTGDSATLLSNVVVVTENTGGLAQRMTQSADTMQQLAAQRAETRQQVRTLQARERQLAVKEDTLQSRSDAAAGRVENLMGGPAVAYAMSKVGNGYVFGASGPSVFDCSGLTMAAWATAGVSLPHSSSAQYSSGRHISESELQPGDLVFYYSPISHVGMYIGGGKIVNALNPGAGVVISGLHDMPYVGAVRPG
jgi:cell wall-associated NlpC family hydrolase